MFNQAIEKAIQETCLHPEIHAALKYATLPAGKLFRPRLVEAISHDLCSNFSKNHLHLAVAIELHHSYSLVHDDLPCMDNDLIRRGKPSTHAKFGEWKAILAGDALLIASFQELAKICSDCFYELHRLMSWTTGAKGLIAGQYEDLKANGLLDFEQIVRVHELKTGRLIQLATLGTYYLSEKKEFRGKIDFLKLGRDIGVSFQLIDDLTELIVESISEHEKGINPFLHSHNQAIKELEKSISAIHETLHKHKLERTKTMLSDYFKNHQSKIINGLELIEKNVQKDLSDLRNWATRFV